LAGKVWNRWLARNEIVGWQGMKSLAGKEWNRWLARYEIVGWQAMKYMAGKEWNLFHSTCHSISFHNFPWLCLNRRAGTSHKYIINMVATTLAEAHWHNSNPASGGPVPALPAEDIPYHLREYADVFSKDSFDVLPDSGPWDHAVELIPDAKAASCKVYPLSPAEQKELDAFLEENLETGRWWAGSCSVHGKRIFRIF
jgi:hypothetical protein